MLGIKQPEYSSLPAQPINVPKGVTVTIGENNNVAVKGPKGELKRELCVDMIIKQEDSVLTVARKSDDKDSRSLHGLTRTLLANMVEGVANGFKKELDIVGVGYRAQKTGKQLVMNIGYSHQVIIDEVPGINIEVPAPNKIIIEGADKQQVGQFTADIRKKRPPEPYHGKGIKYSDEVVRRKEGKSGKK